MPSATLYRACTPLSPGAPPTTPVLTAAPMAAPDCTPLLGGRGGAPTCCTLLLKARPRLDAAPLTLLLPGLNCSVSVRTHNRSPRCAAQCSGVSPSARVTPWREQPMETRRCRSLQKPSLAHRCMAVTPSLSAWLGRAGHRRAPPPPIVCQGRTTRRYQHHHYKQTSQTPDECTHPQRGNTPLAPAVG